MNVPQRNIEDDIKEFVMKEVEESQSYQADRINKVKEYTKRYEAKRSISGLLGWGDDPRKSPKTEPWDGASDVGIPIDAFTIEGLLPRFLKVCFGIKPIAWITATKPIDVGKAPIVQEALNYQLTRLIKIYRKMKLIYKTVIIEGDAFAKCVWEKKTRPFNKVVRNLQHPITGELLIDPQTQKPVEVKEDYVPQPIDQFGTMPNIVKNEIQNEKTIYEGPMIYGRTIKEIVVPKNADSPEIDDWPWIADTYKKTYDWFVRKEGDIKEGKFKNVDKLWEKLIEKSSDHQKAMREEIKVIEWHGKYDIDKDDKDEELVVFLCPDQKILLGWMLSPTPIRPFFHYQIIPMEGRPFGKGVVEFLLGLRDMVDAVFNQMIDRGSIDNNPPIIVPSDHEDELNPFGPGVKWKSDNPGGYNVLQLPKSEQMEFAKMNFLLGMVQKLFGVTDYAMPEKGSLASNRTYAGIATIVGEGNIKFDDMIRGLQDINEDLFEFIVNLNSEFLDDDFIYELTGQRDNPFKSIKKSFWAGNYDYESVGNSMNINRQLEQQVAAGAYRTAFESYGKNPAISELTMLDVTRNWLTSMDIRNVRLNTEQQVEQIKQTIQQKQEQEIQMIVSREIAKLMLEGGKIDAKKEIEGGKLQAKIGIEAAKLASKHELNRTDHGVDLVKKLVGV